MSNSTRERNNDGRKLPIVTSLLAVVMTGVVLAGCSTSNSAVTGLTPRQTHAVAISEERRLTLPVGDSWPTIVFQKGVVYQSGDGQNRVDQIWFCDWSESLLADSPSAPNFAVALSRVEDIRHTYMYRFDMGKDTRSSINGAVEGARLGDTGPLASNVRLNCH